MEYEKFVENIPKKSVSELLSWKMLFNKVINEIDAEIEMRVKIVEKLEGVTHESYKRRG